MEEIQSYSFECGVIDCFNEMIRAGIKSLALSRPLPTAQARDEMLPFAREACQRYGTKLYIEDEPLLSDLFPLSLNKGKYNILFYSADHILEQYLRLKEHKQALVAEGAYFGGNRSRIAWDFGRLLSYPEEVIRHLIEGNQEREQV